MAKFTPEKSRVRFKPRPPTSADPRCRGKRMYLSRDQAVSHLNRLRQKPQPRKALLGTYTCKFCAHFHIGHDYMNFNGAIAR